MLRPFAGCISSILPAFRVSISSHSRPHSGMTPAQADRLELFRAVHEVCKRNGLAISHQPAFRAAVPLLANALKALDSVIANPPPEDASLFYQQDFQEQIAAGFRAVEWVINERMIPNLPTFEHNSPKFYGEMKTALMSIQRKKVKNTRRA